MAKLVIKFSDEGQEQEVSVQSGSASEFMLGRLERMPYKQARALLPAIAGRSEFRFTKEQLEVSKNPNLAENHEQTI